MFIKDSYILTASRTVDVKDRQEVTVNLKLNKVTPCYHTLLTGRVLYKKRPVKQAVVKVFDCEYQQLFFAITNCRGIYQFNKVLAPGIYKVVATANCQRASRIKNVKVKAHKIIRKSFCLKMCKF